MVRLAAVGLRDRRGQMGCVSLHRGNRATRQKRQKESITEKRRERERERASERPKGARGRNAVAACQPLIRALVRPLWVGVRDCHCKHLHCSHTCTRTHTHTHRHIHGLFALWMSALLSGTSQQITDKTCTRQTTSRLPIAGVTLGTLLSKRTHKTLAAIFKHTHNK